MPEETNQKILIVDDESGIRKALLRVLRPLGVELIEASGGEEALLIVARQHIALIISDQRMPGMTGVELLGKIKEQSPDTVRILLTGYADINATIESINTGAVKYYFNKPWDDDLLYSRVEESLRLADLTRENRRLQALTSQQNEQLRKINLSLKHKVDERTAEVRAQHEALKKSFMDTIRAFSTIVEIRSKEVGSHSQRVAMLARRMMSGASHDAKGYQDVIVAAYLHDIGKIGLPDRLQDSMPDGLSEADSELLRRHAILGQSCVYNIDGFEEIGLIIRHHHENYDGTGYPDMLREECIPYGSRLIRVVDAFDEWAFAGGYPDRRALNEAAAELVRRSGVEFDPQLVKRFIDLDVSAEIPLINNELIIAIQPEEMKEGMVVASDIVTTNGLFLLPKGAKLSRGMISRINKIHAVDPVTHGVKIYKDHVEQSIGAAVPAKGL